jgi:hypothetical protein
MDPNAFRNGNTSNNNLFEINSAKEAEMEWETENTNKYYSNRKEADEEFWNKHKDALNHPYH